MNLQRMTQVGVGIAGLVGGYAIGSTVINHVRHADLVGPATREIGHTDDQIFEQQNMPLADKLTKASYAATVASVIGGIYLLRGTGTTLTTSIPKLAAGSLLITGGVGVGVGAVAAADHTSDITSRPRRTPPTTGIAVTTP